jgi:heme-degrading monooxygenase HmoA
VIIEHALLQIRAGEEAAFEAAMGEAKPLISASAGFQRMEVRRGIESPGTYLLIVHWNSVDDHEIGFRGSDRYQEWRGLLHHFYDPMPVVSHFGETV